MFFCGTRKLKRHQKSFLARVKKSPTGPPEFCGCKNASVSLCLVHARSEKSSLYWMNIFFSLHGKKQGGNPTLWESERESESQGVGRASERERERAIKGSQFVNAFLFREKRIFCFLTQKKEREREREREREEKERGRESINNRNTFFFLLRWRVLPFSLEEKIKTSHWELSEGASKAAG